MLVMPVRRRWPKILLLSICGAMAVCASAIGGGVYALLFIAPATSHEMSAPPAAVSAAVKDPVAFAQPTRLKIPKINVDAPIDQVGLTPDGTLEAPHGAKNVGWYKLGPRPGDKGEAVIDGHYGTWKNGATSVFDKLNKLLPGDRINVQDATGATASFVVREYKIFPRTMEAPEVFKSPNGGAHLNLITCQGTWNEAQQTYADRLVVFADLAPPISKH